MPTIQTSCYLQTLLFFCLALSGFAQSPPTDSIPVARAAIFYQSYVGADAAIYNGVAYQPNYRGIEGTPYFQSENLTTGSLIYEGLTYTHIPLLYDLVHDQLLISDQKGQLLIVAAGKARQFTFADHLFFYLTVNGTSGYYERLTTGYATLYARHTRKIEEKIQSNQLYRTITAHDEYYLYKQGRYYPVESGNHLLTLLADKKKELQQFQRSNHIRFRKEPEVA